MKNNDLIRERDVLGLEKPANQFKKIKRKSNVGFLILTLVIFVAAAVVLYFIDKLD